MFERLLVALFLVAFSASTFGATNCLPSEGRDKLFNRAGIYIGELHGTEESPAFLRCFVESVIEMKISKPIVVSLEMPESARQNDAAFWDGKDGRTSRAMWEMIQAFSQLEKENKIVLHFQYLDLWPAGSPVDADGKIALRINEALSKGFVIAYSGNLHNARKYPFKTDKQSARMLLGDKMVSLRLGALEGGQAWMCTGQPIECGVKDLKKKKERNLIVNTLYEDIDNSHDYLLYLEKFTASLPYRE